MDSLLGTIVVLLIMAVSSWLQKKAEEKQRSTPPAPHPPQQPPQMPPRPGGPATQTQPQPRPVRGMDWQEELRRLLEGDAPPAPPPPLPPRDSETPAPPPIVVRPKPKPQPIAVLAEEEEGPQTSRLTQSVAAYKKAQQLHEEAATRLQETVEQTKVHKLRDAVSHGRQTSREIASAISLVRSRASVRQAFVASVVLSPPKGLEN